MVKTLVFFDARGGALASLAASILRSRGVETRAESSGPIVERPEIATVLAEIGVTSVVAPIQRSGARPEHELHIELGGSRPAPVDVSLYEGPDTTNFGSTELERLAKARISRDRIERWVDRGAQPA
ncbi:MAG: hypothetical protein HOW73_25760 [Polyangiaceae bacterium]|nr:hypothetical protein [Polyangiaceae bacterium]